MPDTLQIYVESNVDWNIEREAGWLEASKSEAQDGAQWLTVTVMENSEIEPRTASITLSAGTVSSEIAITQKGAEFTGLLENLTDFPYTYGVASSQNANYILGMKDADAEGYWIPEIVNVMTGEHRELEATDQWDYAVAISDEGDDYILHSRRFGGYLVCVDDQEMELNDYVLLVLRYLAVITAVVALVYALRRVITETVFRIRFAFAGSNKAAVLCYNRLVNHIAFKFKLNAKVLSPRQVLEILGGCGIDANEIVDDFEKSLYGGKNLEAEDKKRILMVYKSAIKMLIRYKLTENKQNQTVTAPQP